MIDIKKLKKIIAKIEKIIPVYDEVTDSGTERQYDYSLFLRNMTGEMKRQIENELVDYTDKEYIKYSSKYSITHDLFYEKKYDIALNCLKIWETELDYGFLMFMKGLCLQNSGRFEEAIVCYDNVQQMKDLSKEYKCLYYKGQCLLQLGRFNEGMAFLEEVMHFWGYIYTTETKPKMEEAEGMAMIAGIDRFIALCDEIGYKYSNILEKSKGNLFLEIGKENEGIECHSKIKNWDALCEYYFNREQYDEAFKYCQLIGFIVLNPDNVFISNLISARKYETALDFMKVLKTEDEENASIRESFCLQMTGKWEEALAGYDYILSHQNLYFCDEPEDNEYICELTYYKALCLLHLGRMDEGMKCLAEIETDLLKITGRRDKYEGWDWWE
jgi:tetratricopeptide (TPR) repeat protein